MSVETNWFLVENKGIESLNNPHILFSLIPYYTFPKPNVVVSILFSVITERYIIPLYPH